MKKIIVLVLLIALGAGTWYAYTNQIGIFSNQTGPSLADTSWQWDSTVYQNGDEVISEHPELFESRFTADGQFSTGTDCNTASGSYTLDGETITFGPMAVTLMACAGDIQERVYLDDLNQVNNARINAEGLLELETADGTIMYFAPVTEI
ncbi:MAG: META domain-containing protein [Patescibacteria group bacterium]